MNISKILAVIFIWIIGIPLHVRKVQKARRKKEVAWELEIYHSVTCVIFFTLMTIFDVVQFTCPKMDDSFASFFLQSVWFIRSIGTTIILWHSLNVALYKYFIIVIKKPIIIEDKTMDVKYLVLLILSPIMWAIAFYFRNIETLDFIVSPGKGCQFGSLTQKNTRATWLCNFDDDDEYENKWTLFYLWTEFCCITQAIASLIFLSNVFEAYVYYRIFSFARR